MLKAIIQITPWEEGVWGLNPGRKTSQGKKVREIASTKGLGKQVCLPPFNPQFPMIEGVKKNYTKNPGMAAFVRFIMKIVLLTPIIWMM